MRCRTDGWGDPGAGQDLGEVLQAGGYVQHDHVVARQVGQSYGLRVRQQMPGREQHMRSGQVEDILVDGGLQVDAVEQGKFAAALQQQPLELDQGTLHEVEDHLGESSLKPLQQPRQQERREGGETADHQPARRGMDFHAE